MLLISKISTTQLIDYRRDVIKCLNNYIENVYLTEVLVFMDRIDDNLPKNRKIRYVIKPRYSQFEIIQYSKKLSKNKYIIYTDKLKTFGNISNLKESNYVEEKDFFFFNNQVYDTNQLRLDKGVENNRLKPKKVIKRNAINTNKENIINKKIDVIIVSVNYNKYLKLSLQNNTKIFDNITVVTSNDDIECQKICNSYNVNCIICDDILKEGVINKSIGINKGIKSIKNPDWILILDADIIVNDKIDINDLCYQNLYVNSRWIIEDTKDYELYKNGNKKISEFRFEKSKGMGFLQLFNWKVKRSYPDSNWGRYSESTWSDIIFKKGFDNIVDLKLEVIHVGKPYQKWNVDIDEPELDNSILKKSKRDPNIKPKLAVLTTFFNPKNYINLRYNYLKFSEKIKQKADLFPIELSFNGDFFIEDENVIRINGSKDNILWQKERLLNIALENLPKEYTNVAWIDCDIIFENENWVDEVNDKLKEYKVLHLFEKYERIGDNDEVSESGISIIKEIIDSGIIITNIKKGKPGFAWAIRRELIDDIKFFDKQVIGGGDTLMFYSFVSKYKNNGLLNKNWFSEFLKWYKYSSEKINKSVHYISGNIKHLYHGKRLNRNYNNRYNILNSINFSPSIDLIKNGKSLWEFKNKNNYKLLMNFFENRNEDDNVIRFEDYDKIYFNHFKDYMCKYTDNFMVKDINGVYEDMKFNKYTKCLFIENILFNKNLEVELQEIRNNKCNIDFIDSCGNKIKKIIL